jgi:hypothetical protein
MKDVGPALIAFVAALIGLAILSVIVSQKSQTPNLIKSVGDALAGLVGRAAQPV